ncbi:PREDICTED: caspase-1 isoform X2 [Ceratosolen solmsi marchali]|uniref:Caspase-1 isoform X2 n=1 Tax=Ceratosolen solmsi marchali TaxID=326594 RepID=A0AAJ6YML8_9HYME|nr:PREDICTED: caspase-1 isoform X2 [Ceratosolen solmsi marchali]
MEYKDREKIDRLCNQLLQSIDIDKLWPKLLENQVYNRDDVNIPNWQKHLSSVDTVRDICTTIKTRGPHAYKNFILSLSQSGHQPIVDQLENHRSSNIISNSNNNNIGPNNETSSNSIESANNSNFDEHSKDDYHTKLVKNFEPLSIKVRKADVFKDGPEIKDIERYPMRSIPRGLVLIITNIVYEMVDCRPSAKYDEANLKQLFEEMGFKVIIHSNLTGDQIKKKVKEFSKMKELRRVDSAFIIISSHGAGEHGRQETEIQGTDYKLPNYETVFCTDIIDYFTAEQCPNLCGKPKIFIFQTCRGIKHQKAVSRSVTDTVTAEFSDTEQPYNLSSRNYEDTLIAYATLPGYVSYRDTYNGSWFIQILCEVFMNYACERHIQDLFVMTDRRLKDLRTACNKCQTLWVINQGFHKHCFLNPGLFHKSSEIN